MKLTLPVGDIETSKPQSLGEASKAFDRGDKGFLDEVEKVARSYDKNNDGKIDVNDVIRLAEDLQSVKTSHGQMKKFCIAAIGLALMLLATSFALTFVAVSLSQQLAVENGALVSKGNHEVLMTIPEGSHITIEWDETFLERQTRHLLGEIHRKLVGGIVGGKEDGEKLTEDDYMDAIDLYDSSKDRQGRRHLQETDDLFLIGSCTREEVTSSYEKTRQNRQNIMVSGRYKDREYTRAIRTSRGGKRDKEDGTEIFNQIQLEDDDEAWFTVECKGRKGPGRRCQIYSDEPFSIDTVRRQLGREMKGMLRRRYNRMLAEGHRWLQEWQG